LDVARVREDDELAEQPEREQLHPEHHEERGQEQRRPVSERMAEDEAVDRKPGDEQRAHEERRHPHHSEESQRLLREAHEEEHRADIEHSADVLPQPIATLQAIERRLPQLDLSHFEANTARQHRQEAMLVAVEIDLVEHPALHRPPARGQRHPTARSAPPSARTSLPISPPRIWWYAGSVRTVRPRARWNPATSAVASPNLRVRPITEIRSPEESSLCTSAATSGRG